MMSKQRRETQWAVLGLLFLLGLAMLTKAAHGETVELLGPTTFGMPGNVQGLTLKDGKLYFGDASTTQGGLYAYDLATNTLSQAIPNAGGVISLATFSGELYGTDSLASAVYRYDLAAKTKTQITSLGGGAMIRGMEGAPANLIFGTMSLNKVYTFTPGGDPVAIVGSGQWGFDADDGLPALQSRVANPTAATIGGDGTTYYAEFQHRIRYVKDGRAWTLGGSPQSGYDGDGGPVRLAHFSKPFDVLAIPPDLYIADMGNCAIRRIVNADGLKSSAMVETVATQICGTNLATDGVKLYAVTGAQRKLVSVPLPGVVPPTIAPTIPPSATSVPATMPPTPRPTATIPPTQQPTNTVAATRTPNACERLRRDVDEVCP